MSRSRVKRSTLQRHRRAGPQIPPAALTYAAAAPTRPPQWSKQAPVVVLPGARLFLLTVRPSLRASNTSAASAASVGSISSPFPVRSECACHRTSASGHAHTCRCRRKLDRGKIEESCRRNCICAAMQGRVRRLMLRALLEMINFRLAFPENLLVLHLLALLLWISVEFHQRDLLGCTYCMHMHKG
ncbi:uncharacterized protein [Miscanthus floridulus]|uniref:uncharacterized protein n=1 Tax=Miscanthus floridulus TaxID=154761 RepID=UPI00345898F3